MSASSQQHALSPLQKMEDPSGTAMPTSVHSLEEADHPIREETPRFVRESTSPKKPSPQKHADPPADLSLVASDRVGSTSVERSHPVHQQGPSSVIQREGYEADVLPQVDVLQTPSSSPSHKSEPSYQSHQTHGTHFTASSGSGPDFKDQARSRTDGPLNSNIFSDIVFAENVQVVQSVEADESRTHKEHAAPFLPPRQVAPDTSPVSDRQQPLPRAPLPQEDGGRRCSKRALIFVGVALLVIIAGVVGGVVGAISGSNDKGPIATDVPVEGPIATDVPSLSPTNPPTTLSPTGAPTQVPTAAPVARDIAIVEFIESITYSDSVIVYPPPTSAVTPEEAAVIWLIENTNISVGDPLDEFRLTQKYALLVLYYATQGESWTNKDGWLDPNTDECEWNGIECESMLINGNSQDVVSEIDLVDNNLNGDFPADIALLQGLQVLDLWDNPKLTGQIPTSIGLLSSMVDFAVANCGMSGPLPEVMSSWTNLRDVRGL